MGTKRSNITDPNSCWNKAGLDEPVFVIRARDPLFPECVDHWAKMAERYKFHESDKIARARAESRAGEAWRIGTIDSKILQGDFTHGTREEFDDVVAKASAMLTKVFIDERADRAERAEAFSMLNKQIAEMLFSLLEVRP